MFDEHHVYLSYRLISVIILPPFLPKNGIEQKRGGRSDVARLWQPDLKDGHEATDAGGAFTQRRVSACRSECRVHLFQMLADLATS
jgi:hypothetical protein